LIIGGRFVGEPSVNWVIADERANYRRCGHCRIARTAVEVTATTASGRFAANSLASSGEFSTLPVHVNNGNWRSVALWRAQEQAAGIGILQSSTFAQAAGA
jgi:hypothetical protein